MSIMESDNAQNEAVAQGQQHELGKREPFTQDSNPTDHMLPYERSLTGSRDTSQLSARKIIDALRKITVPIAATNLFVDELMNTRQNMFAEYIQSQVNVYKSYLLSPRINFVPASNQFTTRDLSESLQVTREHAVVSFQSTTGAPQPANRIAELATDLAPYYVSSVWRFAAASEEGYANWGTTPNATDGPMYLYTEHDFALQTTMRFSKSAVVRHVGLTPPIVFELRKDPKLAEVFLRLETPEMQRPANLNTDIAGNASWSAEVLIARMLKNSYVGNGIMDSATLVGSRLMVPWMVRLIKLMMPALVQIPVTSTSALTQVNISRRDFTYVRPYQPKPSFSHMDCDAGTDPWSTHNFYYCGIRDYSTFLAGGSNVPSIAIARARGARPIFLEIDMFSSEELQVLISSFILDYAFYREFRPIYDAAHPVETDVNRETKLPGYRYFVDNWKIPDSAGQAGALQSWIIVDIGASNRTAPPPFLAVALGGIEYIRSIIEVAVAETTDAIYDNSVYDATSSGAFCRQLLAKLVPVYGDSIDLAFSFLENKLLGARPYPMGKLDLPNADSNANPPATSVANQITPQEANYRTYTYRFNFGPSSNTIPAYSSEKASVHAGEGIGTILQNQFMRWSEPISKAVMAPDAIPSCRLWFNPYYDDGRIRCWPFPEADSTKLTDATFSSKTKPSSGSAADMIYEYLPAESSENMLVARLTVKPTSAYDITARLLSMITACYENFATMQSVAELGMPAVAMTHGLELDRFRTCNLFRPQGADMTRAHLPNRCSALRTAMRAAGVDKPVATRNDFGRDNIAGLEIVTNLNCHVPVVVATIEQNILYRRHICFGGWLTMYAKFEDFIPNGFFYEPSVLKQRQLLSEDLMVQIFRNTQVFANLGAGNQLPVMNYVAGASTAIRALTLQTIGTANSDLNLAYINSANYAPLPLVYHINSNYQPVLQHDRYNYTKVQLLTHPNIGGSITFHVINVVDNAGTVLTRGTTLMKQINSLQTQQAFKRIVIQPSLTQIAPYSL